MAKRVAFPSKLRSGNESLTLVPSKLLLVFKKALSEKDLLKSLKKLDLELEDGSPQSAKQRLLDAKLGELDADEAAEKQPKGKRLNDDESHRWVRHTVDEALDVKDLNQIETEFDENLKYIAPVYHRDDMRGVRGLVSPQPDMLLIRHGAAPSPHTKLLSHALDFQIADKFLPHTLNLLGLTEVPERSKHSRPYRVYKTKDINENSAYQVAPQLRTSSVVFRIIPMLSPLAGTLYPIDAQFGGANDDESDGNQWYMKRIGAPYAWFESTGDPNTVVYLFDLGVQFGLSDMPTFTQFRMSDDTPEATTQPNAVHGTAMISAMGSPHTATPGGGMAGLAPDCTFVSLRGGSPLSNSDFLTAINHVANDITATPGPERILCVAAAASTAVLQDTAVNDALHDVLQPNCLVCVPAGDFGSGAGIDPSSAIGYQAYVATQPVGYDTIIPNMIICGMTEPYAPATHYDYWRDTIGAGVNNVGSKYGPELNVVAPGVGIQCRTSAGYATSIGTSFSTALVAGIAALVRSVEPALTAAQVRDRIERCAAKTGQYGYDDGPNGPKNDRCGYGRVDAGAVTVHVAAGQSTMMIRDNPADEGTEPSVGWWVSDMIIVTSSTIPGDTSNGGGPVTAFPAASTQGSALDGFFTAAVAAGNTTIGASGDHYVFVRVKNKAVAGTADARCIRATCNLAACSTGFTFPDDWMQADDDIAMGLVVAGADNREDGYYANPLPPEGIIIFRLHVTAAQIAGIHSAAFEYAPGMYHACALPMVLATNDISPFSIVGDVRTAINNITQRNLAVV